jgi:hypothetical protein
MPGCFNAHHKIHYALQQSTANYKHFFSLSIAVCETQQENLVYFKHQQHLLSLGVYELFSYSFYP